MNVLIKTLLFTFFSLKIISADCPLIRSNTVFASMADLINSSFMTITVGTIIDYKYNR